MHCTCDEPVSDTDVRWANEQPYCENADEILTIVLAVTEFIREHTLYDSSGILCNDC
jgi:hypothetical protein